MQEHTERLLSVSARQLLEAESEAVSDALRVSAAFVSGYNCMQAIQPPYLGALDDHPLKEIMNEGAARAGISKSDLTLGLALRYWVEFRKYRLEPSPASVQEAIDWAVRVRDAVQRRLETE